MSRSSKNYGSETAKQRFKAMRREMREQGDDTYEAAGRGKRSPVDSGCCHCTPDIVPPWPISLLGYILALAIIVGGMVFVGIRVGWWAPVSIFVCLFIVLLPSLIEFMCRGTRVLKRDRTSFFFWWW